MSEPIKTYFLRNCETCGKEVSTWRSRFCDNCIRKRKQKSMEKHKMLAYKMKADKDETDLP